ncbi:MAG: tetratricopeptide repeat protein [Ignavibacteria bacterium]|jgi:tetratricopeptide (TPR) repeat protein
MKSNKRKSKSQFEIICSNCQSAIILEPDEIKAGEFTCPECNKLSEFSQLDLKEIVEEIDEEITGKPNNNPKKYYIIAIVVIALGFGYYFADSSDSISFINKKGKSDKHFKAGSEIFSAQINSPQPDQKEMEKALEEFKKAIEIDKDNTDALLSKAIVLAGTGKFQESLIDLDKVITLNQNIPDAYLYRALCKLQLGDIPNSIPDFDKTIELSPDNLNAIFYRANAKFELKNFEGAKDDMNKIIASNPNIPNSYAFRGLCDINLGNSKAGCEDLKKSKELGLPEADTLLYQYCK